MRLCTSAEVLDCTKCRHWNVRYSWPSSLFSFTRISIVHFTAPPAVEVQLHFLHSCQFQGRYAYFSLWVKAAKSAQIAGEITSSAQISLGWWPCGLFSFFRSLACMCVTKTRKKSFFSCWCASVMALWGLQGHQVMIEVFLRGLVNTRRPLICTHFSFHIAVTIL